MDQYNTNSTNEASSTSTSQNQSNFNNSDDQVNATEHPALHSNQTSSSEPADARPIMRYVAFFLGDLRDGIAMMNMQSYYLLISKKFNRRQLNSLVFTYGVSQFLSLGPAGYLYDTTHNKIRWLGTSAFLNSLMTVLTVLFAQEYGQNLTFMLYLKAAQGCATAFLPTGLNSITLGIVGCKGMTFQASRNKMYSHWGTALIVFIAAAVSFFMYPDIRVLFFVSPLWALGVLACLHRIKPTHVNDDAARALIIESPTMIEYQQTFDEGDGDDIDSSSVGSYEIYDDGIGAAGQELNDDAIEEKNMQQLDVTSLQPSSDLLNISVDETSSMIHPNGRMDYVPPALSVDTQEVKNTSNNPNSKGTIAHRMRKVPSYLVEKASDLKQKSRTNLIKWKRKALAPFTVMTDQRLLMLTYVLFLFHLANTTILPLVMGSINLENEQHSIMLSVSCIIVAQSFMVLSSKFTGDYTPKWGRKPITMIGLASLPIRCFVLVLLYTTFDIDGDQKIFVQVLLLSTQILDAIGMGIIDTVYVLIASDISGGTGRFSLLIGMSSAAASLGQCISGFIGQNMADDVGYQSAFGLIGVISLLPLILCWRCLPETLPDYARIKRKFPSWRRKATRQNAVGSPDSRTTTSTREVV